MAYVRRCYDDIRDAERHGLRRQNHIAVNGLIPCCWLSSFAPLTPKTKPPDAWRKL